MQNNAQTGLALARMVLIFAILSMVNSLSGNFNRILAAKHLSESHKSIVNGKHNGLQMTDNLDFDPTGNTDPEYQKFLSGPEGKPWGGTRIALSRKGQVPLPEYSAQDVVRICLAALQNNDDPQLDHGACVSLEFKSPTGPLAEGGLDPAAYGRFIRGSDYSSLIDFKTYELAGELEQLSDSLSVRQGVRIIDWQSSINSKGTTNYDFYLTQVRGCWLLDIILLRK